MVSLPAFAQLSHTFTQTARSEHCGSAMGVAIDSAGTVFLANGYDGIRAYRFDGESFTLAAHVNDGPLAYDITLDSNGTLFVANGPDG